MKLSAHKIAARLLAGTVLLSFQLLLPGVMATQGPAVRWAIRAGGNSDDDGNAIAVDAAGNCHVTGQFSGSPANFGGANLPNRGNMDCFAVKYDNTGKLLWARGAGGTGNDAGLGIAVDGAGNCYVTGTFSSTNLMLGGNATLSNIGAENIFLIKYDSGGNLVWGRSAGGSGADVGTSVATDAAGNCYVTGFFSSSNAAFGSVILTNNSPDFDDIFLAKYDADGNVLWAKGLGGDDEDASNGVGVDAAGNSYITGFFYSATANFGGTTLTNTDRLGSSEIFIAKYDSTGRLLWAKAIGGSSDDAANGIAVTAAGNHYMTGFFQSDHIGFGNVTLTNGSRNGASDIFVAQLDQNGQVLWARAAGGTQYDYGLGIAVDGAGNCQVAGYFHSTNLNFGGIILTNAVTSGALPPEDVFVASYGPSGNLRWAQRAGGTFPDFAYGVGNDGSGNTYVTGTFKGPASFGSTNLSSTAFDIFVERIDALPKLGVTRMTDRVLLSWPTNQSGYQLQFCPNLNSTNVWSTMTNVSQNGDQNVITNSATGDRKFYRLVK